MNNFNLDSFATDDGQAPTLNKATARSLRTMKPVELGHSAKARKELSEYIWEQVGMFGDQLYTHIHVPGDGDHTHIDLVLSNGSNLVVYYCPDCAGTVYPNRNLGKDWLLETTEGELVRVENPAAVNKRRIDVLCNALEIPSDDVASVIVFPDNVTLCGLEYMGDNLRVETVESFKRKGYITYLKNKMSDEEVKRSEELLHRMVLRGDD